LFSFIFPSNTFSDPDIADVLTYTATLDTGAVLPNWLTLNPVTREFNGTPPNQGETIIKLIASDPIGANTSLIFSFLTEPNNAPVVANQLTE
jgi:hypothetical protein